MGYVKKDVRDLISSPPGLVDFVTLYTLQLIVTEFEMKLCTPSGGEIGISALSKTGRGFQISKVSPIFIK